MSAALAFPLVADEGSLWLTKEAIVALSGLHPRSVERYLNAEGVLVRLLGNRTRNGRPMRSAHVSTLPTELRTKLAPKQPKTLAVMPSKSLGPLFPSEPEPLQISLSPDAEKKALAKIDIIQPLLDYKSNPEKYSGLRLSSGRKVTNSNLLAELLAETRTWNGKPIGVRTLWRWVAEYREGGKNKLARKVRHDQGTSHFFTRYPGAALLVASEFLRPCATYQRAYDALVRDRELLHIPKEDVPAYGTVQRYLDALPEPTKILAREGLRRYNETCAPHLARAYTDIAANSIWVADHQIHDCEVANNCFKTVPDSAPMRLRLTCIMDMRSRKIVGFCWAVEGDSRAILTALRRAIERFGPPEVFYCDNGSDFKKVAKGAQRLRPTEQQIRMAYEQVEQSGALAQLGVRVQFCLPYHAQSKPVERLFRFVHGRLDGIMHTYLTGNSYNRPDPAVLAGAHHRKLVRHGRAHESTLLSASYFIKLGETWIEQDYNAQHKHSGKGMDGQTPDAVFFAGYPADRRRTADPEALALMLHERKTCLVRRTAVTIDKRRWMPLPSDPQSWSELSLRNNSSVTVAYDPLDPRRAVVLNEKGYIVAELQPEELAAHPVAPNEKTSTQVAQMSQIRGRLLKTSSIQIATMHQDVALAGHKSAIEHLADRAGAAVPVDHLVSQRAIRRATRPSDTSHAPASSFDIAADLMKELA